MYVRPGLRRSKSLLSIDTKPTGWLNTIAPLAISSLSCHCLSYPSCPAQGFYRTSLSPAYVWSKALLARPLIVDQPHSFSPASRLQYPYYTCGPRSRLDRIPHIYPPNSAATVLSPGPKLSHTTRQLVHVLQSGSSSGFGHTTRRALSMRSRVLHCS
jgi:hypothetical protein